MTNAWYASAAGWETASWSSRTCLTCVKRVLHPISNLILRLYDRQQRSHTRIPRVEPCHVFLQQSTKDSIPGAARLQLAKCNEEHPMHAIAEPAESTKSDQV